MIEINRKSYNGIEEIDVKGEIDASSSIDLDQAIQKCLEDQTQKILVNCSALEYISSAGLGVFMSYVEELKEKNVRMVLFGLNDRVAHTFGLLGLAELMQIAQDHDAALKQINED
jgi:anti-sigma B factor antagonist